MSNTSITIKTGKCTRTPPEYVKFSYELDDFQKHACNSIVDGNHILVTAHTGSGKTTIAEYACGYAIGNNRNAIYTAPIKALSLQTYHGLKKKHPDWDVGLQTGDITINPEAQVMIMTTEILRDMLYFGIEQEHIINTSVVIFDEVHYIKDRDRGTVWEESIILMPKHITNVMLSATIPQSDKFADWVATCTGKHVDVVNTQHRVVPLTHGVLNLDNIESPVETIMTGRKLDGPMLNTYSRYRLDINDINSYVNQMSLSRLLPALFFRFNRKQCEALAQRVHDSLVTDDESKEINRLFNRSLAKFKKGKFDGLSQVKTIHNLLLRGICFHHSGLIHEMKEIIQEIFAAGLVKVLFVTETFAAGVNVPAKSVVFLDLEKYDSHVSGHRVLLAEEYHQMAGRAGRRGLDTKGNVFLAPLRGMPDSHTMKNMLVGHMKPFISQLQVNPALILKMIRSGKSCLTSISESMLARKNKQQLVMLEEELIVAKKELGPVSELTSEIQSLVAEHDRISKTRQAPKKLRKLAKKIDSLGETVKAQFHKALVNRTDNCENIERVEYTERQVEQCRNRFKYDTDTIMQYLIDTGYLNKASNELTVKGKMASEINECNRILLTELIIDDMFLDADNLNFPNVIALLALFVEERDTGRVKHIPSDVTTTIDKIRKFARKQDNIESKHDLSYLGTNWEINTEFVDLAWMWANGASIHDIYRDTDMYEGNFVRNILKIRSMCKALMKICDVCHNTRLAKVLEDYETLLVRDIVVPDSLCLH